MNLQLADQLNALDAAEWDRLAANAGLFMQRQWLTALHDSGCATAATGWQPLPIWSEQHGQLQGLAPAWLKSHSRGEYVFDWAWAEAWQRAGLDYYPKLLLASPFTPVTGQRLLGQGEARAALIGGLQQVVADYQLSSAHVLFPVAEELMLLQQAGWLVRHGVQFHWQNQGYADFDAFLAALSQSKRKKIRQERRKVRDAGISIQVLCGAEITDLHWQFFERCYRQTYLEHRSPPYLNLDFFRMAGRLLPSHCVLFIARRGDQPIAASWCLQDGSTLYGRYWGALESVDCLHFELCYYSGIEYAIQQGLQCFEGGAQGEHKLARGFTPVITHSAHWIAHPQFRRAIADWLARERAAIADYHTTLFLHDAYKKPCTAA
ncbi:GNAT family N-acetyltransferase [Aquitalea sp. USM4]|uniref:GNAT family N-acetyltransferase n=1 Tax=Aquitalea sp. USM4 TaxID=1590041 RepID=UPI001F61D8A3|nr:GNAT family N-acetyltransferase [Aquitalea sp. USM4]